MSDREERALIALLRVFEPQISSRIPRPSETYEKVRQLEAEHAALCLRWQAASEFVRGVIEALGRPQPAVEAVVDLPSIAMSVVGQIEELKVENATLRAGIDTQQAWTTLALEAQKRAEAAESRLAALEAALTALEKEWRDDARCMPAGPIAKRCADDLAALRARLTPTTEDK